jgi:hypothetical protein
LARRTQIRPIRPRLGPRHRRRHQIATFCTTAWHRRHARAAATPSPQQGHLRSSSARWPASKTTAGEPRGIGPPAPFTGIARLSRRRPRGATRGGGNGGGGRQRVALGFAPTSPGGGNAGAGSGEHYRTLLSCLPNNIKSKLLGCV